MPEDIKSITDKFEQLDKELRLKDKRSTFSQSHEFAGMHEEIKSSLESFEAEIQNRVEYLKIKIQKDSPKDYVAFLVKNICLTFVRNVNYSTSPPLLWVKIFNDDSPTQLIHDEKYYVDINIDDVKGWTKYNTKDDFKTTDELVWFWLNKLVVELKKELIEKK